MANSPDFVAHALELLSGVGPVDARSMFGGHGVYARGVMFGLLDDDELFLKTDEVSRPRFAEAGCRQWVYVTKTKRIESTSWRRPPDEAHEDPEAMLAWATLGLESALRAQAAKGARGKTGGTSRARSRGRRRASARTGRASKASRAAGKRRTPPRSRAKPSRGRARPR